MSTSQIKALFDQRSNAANELRSLYDSAGDAELSAEQVQTEERLNGAISTADERIKALLSLSEGEQRAASAYESLGAEERQVEAPSATDADRLIAVGKGEARSADFAPVEERGTATLIAGTAGVGGNTVPTSFYNTLIESMTEVSTVLTAGATVLRTAGGEPLLIPTATAYPSASLVGENSQIGNQDATFGQKTLNAYKYAFTMQASSELLDDSAVNIVEFLGRRGGEALGAAVGTAAMTGTGSSQPQGIYAASGGLTTQASASGSVAGGFKYEDVITLVHSITRPYRNGASFIANDTHVASLRKLREGTGTGQFLWQPALTAGAPDTLAGYPIYTDPGVPTATTNGSKGIAFGNWSKAVVVRFAGPVRVDASDDFKFDYDVTTWRFIVRFDSEIVDAAAAKVLTYTT
jgi:HK97 family phage major capsid protein